RAIRQGTGQSAASASRSTTAEAPVPASPRRYFGLARKASWPGPAPARVPTPRIRTVPSPRSPKSNRAASSARAWSCSRTGKADSSERAAEGELQALDPVATLVLQGDGIAYGDRSHRRLPGQGHAGGNTQGLGLPVLVSEVDVADVNEGGEPSGTGVEQAREDKLHIADGLQRAPQRLWEAAAVEGVGGSDSVGFESTNGIWAADVVVAEKREAALGRICDDVTLVVESGATEFGSVAVAVAVTYLRPYLHDQPGGQRKILLIAVVKSVVLQVAARQHHLCLNAVERAACRVQEIVSGVSHPAGLQSPCVDVPLPVGTAGLWVGGRGIIIVVVRRRVLVFVVVHVYAREI